MKECPVRILSRVLIFLFFIIFLDSCRLFRKRDKDTSTNIPPKNTKSTYNSKAVNDIVATARSYTGVPYRSGGTDERGMDCSGLLFSVYSQYGFKIPRISWQQAGVGHEISIDELKAGDWVFFVTNKGGTGSINHAGIVTEFKNNKEVLFIHASSSKGIREDNLFSKYWMGCFAKATRPF